MHPLTFLCGLGFPLLCISLVSVVVSPFMLSVKSGQMPAGIPAVRDSATKSVLLRTAALSLHYRELAPACALFASPNKAIPTKTRGNCWTRILASSKPISLKGDRTLSLPATLQQLLLLHV